MASSKGIAKCSGYCRSPHVPFKNSDGPCAYLVSEGDSDVVACILSVSQSLAIALYFAARGVGQIRPRPGAEPQPYTSPARVLLNGLGSDELLGGYGRHRTAFKAAGWQAVIDEVKRTL